MILFFRTPQQSVIATAVDHQFAMLWPSVPCHTSM